MSRQNRKSLPLTTIGGALWAISMLILLVIWFRPFSFSNEFTLRALFAQAHNIHAGDPVRIAGIQVGQVTATVPAGSATAPATRVTMKIGNSGLPVHADAQLTVRQRTLLEGTVFIELNPGSPSAPVLRSGQTMPATHTAGTVQLDQVLSDFPSDTRRSLQSLLRDLATGLAGQGAAGFNQSIPYWLSAYRDSARVNESFLGLHVHDLSSYLRYGGVTAGALERDPAALRALVTGLNQTAAGFARHDLALSATIAQLPGTLQVAVPALRALDQALPSFRGLISSMRPVIRNTTPAITAGLPLLTQLDGLVSPSELPGLTGDLRRVVGPLSQLSQESLPLLEQVRLAASCQNQVINPWSRMTIQDSAFPSTGAVYQDFPKAATAFTGEARELDANGRIDRLLLQGANYATLEPSGTMLLTSSPLLGLNPPAPQALPAFKPQIPCETQQAPSLASNPTAPSGQARVHPTDLPLLYHYRDRAVRSLLKGGGPAAQVAAQLLRKLLSPGGGFLNHAGSP